MTLQTEPLIFVDLETTGANFANDRIIEVGLVEVDEHGAREWSSLLNPGRPISSFITGLTGIDNEMVSNAPSFEDIATILREKLEGRLFIAHNARFDYSFIKSEFKRIGIEFRSRSLCTVKLSRKLFPEHHRHSLDTLIERFSITVTDRHRALTDARVLWDLWQHWHQTLPEEALKKSILSLSGKAILPQQIDPSVADDLPESPGAFAFLNEDNEPLLIKRCSNLRHHALSYFSAEKQGSAIAKNTYRIEWSGAAGEFGARLAEIRLEKFFRPQGHQIHAWLLKPNPCENSTLFTPQLVTPASIDFASCTELYGIYYSKREAHQALKKIAEANQLCLNHLGLGQGAPNQPCHAYKQKNCRGVCAGKEAPEMHAARLMAALAKHQIQKWPFDTPIAIIERDEFGMLEDFHVLNRWHLLGTASNIEDATQLALNKGNTKQDYFDAEIYRLVLKTFKTGKLKVITLTATA